MIDPTQMLGFSDEMSRILTGHSRHAVKLANLSGATPTNPNIIPTQAAPPPAALGTVKSKSPPKGGTLSGAKPTYSKVNTVPTPSPAAGQQTLASPPPVRT